jgi:hypothetical protein
MPNWKKVIVSGSSAHLNQITGSGGIKLADDAVLNIGDGNDLQLYHDGSNSYIKDNGTGNLNYMGGTQTFQNAAGSKTMMVLNSANSVDLNYNNSKKLETTNTGVSVTGTVATTNYTGTTMWIDTINDSNSGDNANINFGGTNKDIVFDTDTSMALTLDSNQNAEFGGHITGSGNISGSSTSHLIMGQISSSGDVVADGDVIAYNSSDIRLKDNIQVIKGSLDKIDGIRGVEFDWNEKSPGWARERGHDIGVIAQEVQKVVPEIVVERKNGYLGVDYKRIIPLLIESIKELKQEVEDLKKKVN